MLSLFIIKFWKLSVSQNIRGGDLARPTPLWLSCGK